MDKFERVKNYEPLFDQWIIDEILSDEELQSVYCMKHEYDESRKFLKVISFYGDDFSVLEMAVERMEMGIELGLGGLGDAEITDFEQYIIEDGNKIIGIDVCLGMNNYYEEVRDIRLCDHDELYIRGLSHIEQQEYEEAANYFLEGQAQQNADCICALGCMYEAGNWFEQNYSEAARLFQIAIDLGSELALCDLGLLYEDGRGVEENHELAFELYMKARDLNLSRGFWRVGFCYEFGIGVEENLELAVCNYREACELGNPDAYYSYALCLEYGEGVAQDTDGAIKYYKKGSDIGDERCDLQLGSMYEYGVLVEKDDEEAFKHYKKAVSSGYIPAYTNLAACYEFGMGTKTDHVKSRELLLTASRAGESRAQIALAFYYEEHEEIMYNLFRAKHWYVQAIKQGEVQAYCGLGYIYEAEWQCPENAFDLYLEACKYDYPPALCNVGYCYEMGIGVERDIKTAIDYYHKAALFDFPRAMCNLASLLTESGAKGADKLAFELHERAANLGYSTAAYNLGVSYQFGYYVEIDLEKAKEYYQKGSSLGSDQATYNLACLLLEEDKEQAMEIFFKMDASGDGDASYRIYRIYKEENNPECMEYLERAIERKHPQAIFDMASIHIETEEYEEAVKYLEQSRYYGYPLASARLAWCYLMGYGVKQDQKHALELLQEKETDLSNYYIGCMYLYGDEVEQSDEEALQYFEKAVALGFDESDFDELEELRRRQKK